MMSDAQIVAQPARDEEDFRSHREQPRRHPVPASTPWLLSIGVSLFDTREGALQIARRRPAWVAELRVTAGRGIHIAATGSHGHRTAWGDPDVLAACVEACHVAP